MRSSPGVSIRPSHKVSFGKDLTVSYNRDCDYDRGFDLIWGKHSKELWPCWRYSGRPGGNPPVMEASRNCTTSGYMKLINNTVWPRSIFHWSMDIFFLWIIDLGSFFWITANVKGVPIPRQCVRKPVNAFTAFKRVIHWSFPLTPGVASDLSTITWIKTYSRIWAVGENLFINELARK